MHGIAYDVVHDEIIVPVHLAGAVLIFRGAAKLAKMAAKTSWCFQEMPKATLHLFASYVGRRPGWTKFAAWPSIRRET